MTRKYERIIKLSSHVLRKEITDGHLKWKVTSLARASGISRTHIYEMLGHSKPEILKNALRFSLEEIYGLSPEREEMRKTMSPIGGILRSRKLVIETPELLAFYFRYRNRPDEIGQMIRHYEKKYLELVSRQTGVIDKGNLLYIRTIIHGVSVAPYLNDSEVEDCLNRLFQKFK